MKDKSVWLAQRAMGELFNADRTSITRYRKNIFDSGDFEEKVVCAKIEHTTPHSAIAEKRN